jgi:hypothetical protein
MDADMDTVYYTDIWTVEPVYVNAQVYLNRSFLIQGPWGSQLNIHASVCIICMMCFQVLSQFFSIALVPFDFLHAFL